MPSDPEEVRTPDDIRDTVIPLYAEDSSVSKRQVVTGRVRVETVTREHEQLVDAQLSGSVSRSNGLPSAGRSMRFPRPARTATRPSSLLSKRSWSSNGALS